jgi:hypothetical protein
MSRYLLCLPCREFIQHENEPDKVVTGSVKLAESRCDRCDDPLPVGTKAAAASFFDRPEHYRSWEHERLATDDSSRKLVRMSLQGYDPANLDDACHFVGVFARKAVEQGWTEEEATKVAKQVTGKRAFEELRQHIEPTPAEPVTWRTQIDRIRDYTRGLRLLADDPNVKPHPVGWWLRGFTLARQGQSQSEGPDQVGSPHQELPSQNESGPESLQKVARALYSRNEGSEKEQQPERAERAQRPSPKLEKRAEATPTRGQDRDRGQEPEW